MPHVIIKLVAGRSEEQKAFIAAEVTRAVMLGAKCDETAVSVGIEDIAPDAWTAQVFNPDILGKAETIYKQPGYDPA